MFYFIALILYVKTVKCEPGGLRINYTCRLDGKQYFERIIIAI